MNTSRESDSTMPEETVSETASSSASLKKKLKVVLITFGVVLTGFAVVYLLTENVSIAPFVYAIF